MSPQHIPIRHWLFVDGMVEMTMQYEELCNTIATLCARHGIAAWLVGGAARTLVARRLGLPAPFDVEPTDLDIAVDGDGLAFARTLSDQLGGSFVALDSERNTGRVVLAAHGPNKLVVDLVQLRAPTIEADLRLRDFTLNAFAIPLDQVQHPNAPFLDLCDGTNDMKQRHLRVCSPTSLTDDSVRILRGIRLANELGLQIGRETRQAMKKAAPLLTQCAAERIRDELLRLLARNGGAAALYTLDEIGALTTIFPELEPARTCSQPRVHFLPVLAHSLETVVAVEWLLALLEGSESPRLPVARQTAPGLARTLPFAERLREHMAQPLHGQSRAALFKLAALLHDNAKPQTKQIYPTGKVSFYEHQEIGADIARGIAQRLRLSRHAIGYIETIVRAHMRPGQLRAVEALTLRAVVRFFRDTGEAAPEVLLHSMADHLASSGPRTDEADWLAHLAWVEIVLDTQWGAPLAQKEPLVTGRDLINELQLTEGPLVGKILREVQEAQASGEIHTKAEAIALAQRLRQEWQ